MTWSRAGILCGAGVLIVALGYFGAPQLGRRLSFFQVRQIEVAGLRYLTESEVVQALGLAGPLSTFDPLDSLRAAAARIPGVAAAGVERRLPGTLRVTVLEELPVALTMLNDRLVPVDHRGHPLPFDPSRHDLSFPIADSGPAPAALLTRILLADPLWYDEVESVYTDGPALVLVIGAHRIRLRPDADQETLQGVLAVRQYLSDAGISWVEIDARYRGRVFVRKGVA